MAADASLRSMLPGLRRALAAAGGSYAPLIASFVLVALLEVAGVGLLPAFIASLNEPRKMLEQTGLARTAAAALQDIDDVRLIEVLGLALAAFFIVKNALVAGIVYFQASVVAARQAALSTRLLELYLLQPYTFHLSRNTADLIRNTTSLTFNIFGAIVIPGCIVVTETLVLLLVAALLLAVNPVATLLAIGVIGAASTGFYAVFRQRLHALGERQQAEGGEMYKWVSQALGGIKESIILGREPFFVETYARHIASFSRSNIVFQTVGTLPRLFMETLVVCGLALVVVVLIQSGTPLASVFSTLVLFGVAALRIMPSVTRIVGALTSIRFHQPAVETVARDLEEATRNMRVPAHEAGPRMRLGEAIEATQLGYAYPGARQAALRDVSIRIPRGALCAFVGRSGAGKSTLVDLLIGLHAPTSGIVLVDGKNIADNVANWQRNIGYVPQSIFLTDDSLRRNVAFGVRDAEIDEERVRAALEDAQLGDFVRGLPDGLDTPLGERGSRLSGGQRQRIGIARALYADPDVLVLDEPTAALDRPTAEDVVAALAALGGRKTVLVIAHQMSTIRHCSLVFLLAEGAVIAQGGFEELAASHPQFQALIE